MSSRFSTLLRGLVSNGARTAPDAGDERLRGRTYPVPFDRVWRAALGLAGGRLERWDLLEADDEQGLIRSAVEKRLLAPAGEVTIRITLDADAQTRVDALAIAPGRWADLGAGARRLVRFFRALDRALE
jgi:hypothetical protein